MALKIKLKKIANILKLSGWELEMSELPWKRNFYSRRCVSCITISLPNFNGLRFKLAKLAYFYAQYNPCIFYLSAYFTPFSNLNVSRTIEDICKRQMAFLSLNGILRDTHKNSRGKNVIILPRYRMVDGRNK